MVIRYPILGDSLIQFSAYIYIAVFFLPVLSGSTLAMNILVLISFIFFLVGVLCRRKINIYIVMFFISILLFNYLIYKVQWVNEYSFHNKMLLLIEFWFPTILAMAIFSKLNEINVKNINNIRNFFISVYTVTCITTILGNIRHEMPSRWLATSDLELGLKYQYLLENIGGFGFCYSILFIIPLFILAYQKDKNKKYLFLLVISYICIYFSQYTTLMILSIFVLLMTLFFMRLSMLSIFGFSLLSIIFVFFFWINNELILNYLAELFSEQPMIQKRLIAIQDFLNDSNNVDASLALRQEVYLKSWNSFLNNPIQGTWNPDDIGMHSEILDLLAGMGLIGVGFLTIIIMISIRSFRTNHSLFFPELPIVIRVNFLMLLLLAILNPIFSSVQLGFILFISLVFMMRVSHI